MVLCAIQAEAEPRFLRRPNNPSAASPEANRGSAAGSGVLVRPPVEVPADQLLLFAPDICGVWPDAPAMLYWSCESETPLIVWSVFELPDVPEPPLAPLVPPYPAAVVELTLLPDIWLSESVPLDDA